MTPSELESLGLPLLELCKLKRGLLGRLECSLDQLPYTDSLGVCLTTSGCSCRTPVIDSGSPPIQPSRLSDSSSACEALSHCLFLSFRRLGREIDDHGRRHAHRLLGA
jgi:hypothetical protein